MTAYEQDLHRIDLDLAALGTPSGTEPVTRHAWRLYQRAALTGRLDQFAAAEAAMDAALARIGPWPDLCLAKANLDLKLHRLAGAKSALALAPGLAASFSGRVVWSSIHLQEGRYHDSRNACEALLAEDPTWDNLARLAYLESRFGEVAAAERLYAEAAGELTAKQMRDYAWIELQLGLLDLRRARYPEAEAHYRRAARAYSGYWLVSDHLAELYGAQGNFDEAARLYLELLAGTPRPELQQAFGELCAACGELAEAGRWFDRALEAFLAAAENGGVHYFHHLADFYSDVCENGAEAVKWARKDYELRPYFATEGALAWALYRDRQTREAASWMDRALASGIRDAHLFAKAATIYATAGRHNDSEHLARRAAGLNPRHEGFHVHRA